MASRSPLQLTSEQRRELDELGFSGQEFFEIDTARIAVLTDDRTNLARQVANDLKGPIAAFNNMSSSMTILGQTVRFDPARTVFDNFSGVGTTGVHAGEMVRVNGFIDPKGTIHATFVQRTGPACESRSERGSAAN